MLSTMTTTESSIMQCSSRLPLKESGSLTSTVRIWKPAVAGWLDVEDSWRELKVGEIGYGGDPNPGQNNFGYYPANTVSSASDQLHINSLRTVGQSYNSLVGAIADTFRQDARKRAEKDAQRAERESQAARERATEMARAQQYASAYQLQMMSLMLGKPLPASFTQAQQPQPLLSLPVSSVPVSSLPVSSLPVSSLPVSSLPTPGAIDCSHVKTYLLLATSRSRTLHLSIIRKRTWKDTALSTTIPLTAIPAMQHLAKFEMRKNTSRPRSIQFEMNRDSISMVEV